MKNISSITYDKNGDIVSSQQCTQGHPSQGPAVAPNDADVDQNLPSRSGSGASDEVRLSLIRAAIGRLDQDNPDLWTKSGKPRTEALEAVLDAPISHNERDAAWASLKSE